MRDDFEGVLVDLADLLDVAGRFAPEPEDVRREVPPDAWERDPPERLPEAPEDREAGGEEVRLAMARRLRDRHTGHTDPTRTTYESSGSGPFGGSPSGTLGSSLNGMAGRELTVLGVAQAPVEAVWGVLTNLEAVPSTLRTVSKVEVLDGDGYRIGTRWRETRRVLGVEETHTMEVTGCEPPTRAVLESLSCGVHYRTTFDLEPADEGTRIQLSFGATHPDPTLLDRITATAFGRVGIVLTRKLLQQDIADIAAAAAASETASS